MPRPLLMRGKWIALFLLPFLAVGCGYRVCDIDSPTLSIPLFRGDDRGLLTDAIIRAVSDSPTLTYVKEGKFILEGEIATDLTEHIGYRYGPDTAAQTRMLIPSEGRREVVVRISLIDAQSQLPLHGPFEVKAEGDFDFINPNSLEEISFLDASQVRWSTLFFSMGQLNSEEEARESALHSLYRNLALQIVEGLEQLFSYRDSSE